MALNHLSNIMAAHKNINIVASTENLNTVDAKTEDDNEEKKEPKLKFGNKIIKLPKIDGYPHIVERMDDKNVIGYDIYIVGSIYYDINKLHQCITLLDNVDADKDINVYINSGGGLVSNGGAIASSITTCKATVTTIAIGQVMSAATFIWHAGHKKEISDAASFMFHFSGGGYYGNVDRGATRLSGIRDYTKVKLLKPMVDSGYMSDSEYDLLINQEENIFISADKMINRLANVNDKSEPPIIEDGSTESFDLDAFYATNSSENGSSGIENYLNESQKTEKANNNPTSDCSGGDDSNNSNYDIIFRDNEYYVHLDEYLFIESIYRSEMVGAIIVWLHSLKEGDVINLTITGNDDWTSGIDFSLMMSLLGSFIDSKATVKTSINSLTGGMSAYSTFVSDEVTIGEFGCLMLEGLSKQNSDEHAKVGKYFFQDVLLARGVNLGIITEDERQGLMSGKASLSIMDDRFNKSPVVIPDGEITLPEKEEVTDSKCDNEEKENAPEENPLTN